MIGFGQNINRHYVGSTQENEMIVNLASEVRPERLKQAYGLVGELTLVARNHTLPSQIEVDFLGAGPGVYLGMLFAVTGLDPERLRPVFEGQIRRVEVRRWANFYWWGLLSQYQEVPVELPREVWSYDDFGPIPLDPEHYRKLSKLLGKNLKVYRQGGNKNTFYFNTHPNGEVTLVEK